jgi:HTH-type transcriptional regulator / antitoxin HigA
MTIMPIRTEEDYRAACERIDEIFQAEPGIQEDDELEILLALVDRYEEKVFPLGMPHPIEAIKIQMQNLGISRKDLGEYLHKSSGRVSDILNRRRALTLGDVRKLSRLLHIPLAVLTQEYSVEQPEPKKVRRPAHRIATD